MGWKNEKGEHMEWTTQNTKAFIEIVYDRMKKKQLQGPTFEIATWEDINNEFENITGQNFGLDRLKNKLGRLRHQHRDFSTGGVWDYKYNKKGMVCKMFKKAQANQATSSVTDPYSIEACMELLNSMEDIPSKMYNNALVRFKDKEWRLMFIKMPSFRRNDWLASLEY